MTLTKLLFAVICALSLASCMGSRKVHEGSTEFNDNGNEPDKDTGKGDARPELLKSGVLHGTIPEFKIPESVRQQIAKFQPNLIPVQTTTFEVAEATLKVDANQNRVLFTGLLKIPNHADEAIELGCTIDKSSDPWTCSDSDMFPVDEKIAAQRRLQATFKCVDTYRCEKVGIDLYVVVDGKMQGPKTFQAEKFQIRRASSGDEQGEDDDEVKPKTPPTPPTPPAQRPAPLKPGVPPPTTPPKPAPYTPPPGGFIPPPRTPQPGGKPKVPLAPLPTSVAPEEDLSESEVGALIDDPNAAVELTQPMRMPTPKPGKYSIPEVAQLKPDTREGIPNQAIGSHTSGHLRQSKQLPNSGSGFASRFHAGHDFGANITVDLLTQAFAHIAQIFPEQPPIMVGNIAKRTGGPISPSTGKGSVSHQTGLDVDIAYPSKVGAPSFWPACTDGALHFKAQNHCPAGAQISSDFDLPRFWLMIKQLTCASNKPVIAMFLDAELKKHVCRYVQDLQNEDISSPQSCGFRALQALKHEGGHNNHVHVRFACPGNRDCQNSWVTLANRSGC